MSSKQPSIRVLGQRSIPSTFIFRSSKGSNDCKTDVQSKSPNPKRRASLSDFLNSKLHKSSVLPNSAQGKEKPFLSPLAGTEANDSVEGESGNTNLGEAEVNGGLDGAFEQFKHIAKQKEDVPNSSANNEVESSSTINVQESRKRRNPFEGNSICLGTSQGANEKRSPRKLLLVLGDDPKPKQKRKEANYICEKKPRPIFNHYASGSGWWDCDMEGVDNEEVGCNEIWEGKGTTTLGELDWHS